MNKNNFFLKYLTVLIAYILISIIIHKPLWKEFIFDNSKIGAVHGEIVAAEWGQENLYKNIINFKNPFSNVDGLLYPFGTNLLSTDSGNGFFFIFLRPFLSTHQANTMIWISQVILANTGMFLLLQVFSLPIMLSSLIGLAYGYMTFLMLRIGHMTYYCVYVFPWFFLFILNVINQKKSNFLKLFYSLGASIVLALSLYHNLYYFIMLCMSIIFLIGYYIIFNLKLAIEILRKNILWLIIFIIFFFLLIYPWLKILYETYLFEGLPKVDGWGGAIQFSSDLFNYFIPSPYGYFLGKYAQAFGYRFTFSSGIFENFTYPGLIILLSYLGGFILFFKRKFQKKYLHFIYPGLFAAFAFWILTLGPFLHVFGKWGITVDEKIRIVVPLPYLILHEIPFLNNIRSPGRLIVPFIFFSYIISAFVINSFLVNKKKIYRISLYILIIFIFVIDQYFIYSPPLARFYPRNAYKKISEDKRKVSVIETPSVVRDGFTYFGDESGFNFFIGQLIYGKPVLAGYFGRIPGFKRDYYIRNPLLGYIGRLMDSSINLNGSIDKTDLDNWRFMDVQKAIDAANFLDVGYSILDEEKDYAATLSANFKKLGFNKILKDNNYSLWKRNVEKQEFLEADIGKDDDMYLGMGWNKKENDGRWAVNKSSVLFKVISRGKYSLNFTAKAFYKDMPTTIYIDKQKIGTTIIPLYEKKIVIPVDLTLEEGLHTVYFLFERSYPHDEGELSAFFKKIWLNKKVIIDKPHEN